MSDFKNGVRVHGSINVASTSQPITISGSNTNTLSSGATSIALVNSDTVIEVEGIVHTLPAGSSTTQPVLNSLPQTAGQSPINNTWVTALINGVVCLVPVWGPNTSPLNIVAPSILINTNLWPDATIGVELGTWGGKNQYSYQWYR